jgi:hypothetical protein
MKTWTHIALAALFCAAMADRTLAQGAASAPSKATSKPAFVVAPVAVYTKDNAPKTPKLEDLPLKESVTQYGITWTFEKPARAGQFITGDWYVVGPVTVTAIDPKPLFDEKDIKDIDDLERKKFSGKYCRNGSVKNLVPALDGSGFDSRVRHNIYNPSMTAHLPIALAPGDSLISSSSKSDLNRGKHYSPLTAVAILTCLKDPVPSDAFRPGYCDRQQTIYRTSDLKRDLLPAVDPVPSTPKTAEVVRYFCRPWMEYNLFHEDHAPNQMDGYGQGLARKGGDAALLLCIKMKPEEKEPLLVGYLQFGIDLWGMLKSGYPGWQAFGGWNSGHKLPIILAGVLLGDEKMAYPSKTYPKAWFQEDEQTAFGKNWMGAPVVFYGHSGVDTATGFGRQRNSSESGPYEHVSPDKWGPDGWESEAYRRCCTSRAWIGATIAAKLMKLEKYWDHDAYFDYEDRWMTEDETKALDLMASLGPKHVQPEWTHEGQVEEKFHEEMWKKYRPTVQPSPTAWRDRKPLDTPPPANKSLKGGSTTKSAD